MSRERLRVDLLAVPEVSASVLYGLHDIFSSAGRDWPMLMEGRPAAPLFDVHVVAANPRPMQVTNNIQLFPDGGLDGDPALVCVPEVAISPDTPLRGRFREEVDWLRRCHARGAILATACSGAMLLAEAGLLEGHDATTHWLFCDALSSYPGVRVRPRQALVNTDGGRIVMAGGGSSWQDLALYLVARLSSVEEAMHLARLHLIDWHDAGQQPFAALARNRQSEDAIIARCQTWIASHYETQSPVSAMLELSGLTERSFHRRFKQATGMSPMEYVHTLRLEESKQMLEAGDTPVEQIAMEVGYEDASFFGRLFRRRVGLTPAQYRRRFGGLRAMLAAQG
ncbi:helix-turn-helix domain-containing protein [Ectothiorhodospiraceae bacterium WFHF3C12]|nr:helix-turn-helix domain-containing protein [Ectothiorhodospiraceae bacterium WFHF3C12]